VLQRVRRVATGRRNYNYAVKPFKSLVKSIAMLKKKSSNQGGNVLFVFWNIWILVVRTAFVLGEPIS
jgi:hypothetical protein